MTTEVVSKNELQGLSEKLVTNIDSLKEIMNTMKESLSDVSDYDGINVTSAANTLISNIENVLNDFNIASTNISSYVDALNQFDVDDFDDVEIDDIIKDSDSNKDNSSTIDLNNPVAVTLESDSSSTNFSSSSSTIVATPLVNYSNSNSYSSSSNSSSSSSGHYFGNTVNVGSPTYSSSSSHTGDSVINGTMTYTPSGKPSSNGRTQRSALESFTIKPGIKDDPNIDISKYHNNVAYGFEVTTGNLCYDLCDEDIDLLCAIVSAESDKSYDDALAVITTILNRCETSNWINSHGRDPIAQATAPNQFVVYQHGSYERYLNGNAPDTVKEAVADALAGVRNHKYTSFRSNGSTSYSNNMISSTGNRYL